MIRLCWNATVRCRCYAVYLSGCAVLKHDGCFINWCSRGQPAEAHERNHYCVDENTERRNHYLDLAGIENYTSRFDSKIFLNVHDSTEKQSLTLTRVSCVLHCSQKWLKSHGHISLQNFFTPIFYKQNPPGNVVFHHSIQIHFYLARISTV